MISLDFLKNILICTLCWFSRTYCLKEGEVEEALESVESYFVLDYDSDNSAFVMANMSFYSFLIRTYCQTKNTPAVHLGVLRFNNSCFRVVHLRDVQNLHLHRLHGELAVIQSF